MTTLRLTLLAFLVFLSGSATLLAGPTYSANFGPSPGPGGTYGNADYEGPNDLSGTILVTGLGGIEGYGTPLNSGKVFDVAAMQISVYNGTGQLNIDSDFIGTIIDSNINSTGGTADFEGYLSASAASFFGVDASTEEFGTMTFQISPARPDGFMNSLVSVGVDFKPGTTSSSAVPEPSSLLLLVLGCLGGVARTGWNRRRVR